ncbi:hypothetical protein INT47_005023 [Mucor saturninus]|uniref:Uncharacterized protein n=1 Tax=Mucor saturninus TaxID=64648 RepID=A0A8H7QKZ3_9FUNG|nr:hypothetical protein INT47_005023 [Mucor saturninus]
MSTPIRSYKFFSPSSILYDTTSGAILYRGEEANIQWESNENQENNTYVRNVFLELYEIYMNAQGKNYESCLHYKAVAQGAEKILLEETEYWGKDLNISKSHFIYVFTLPANWDYDAREKLIRPLFIQAGLIETDDHGRLIFFTRLEANFQLLHDYGKVGTENGRQYILCTVEYKDEIRVTLELVAARYPSFTSVESKYVPQLLKSTSFTVPFTIKERKERIRAYLHKKFNTALPAELYYEDDDFISNKHSYDSENNDSNDVFTGDCSVDFYHNDYFDDFKNVDHKDHNNGDNPDNSSLEHDNNSVEPDNDSVKPDNDSVKPDNDSVKPDNDSVEPDSNSIEFDNNSLYPGNNNHDNIDSNDLINDTDFDDDSDNLRHHKFNDCDFVECHNVEEDYDVNEYNLEQSNIDFIESVTIKDIYEDFPEISETTFTDQMNSMFQHSDKANITAILIHTIDRTPMWDWIFLTKHIDKWFQEYGEQQRRCELMTFIKNDIECVNLKLDAFDRMKGCSNLVINPIKESNKNRDPAITTANSKDIWSEESLGPVYFINLDILQTEVKVNFTYVGENNNTKKPAKNIQCNIKSLDSFIACSKLGQRPSLRMTNRTKLFVECIFGGYLRRYTDIDQRKDIKDLFMCPGSKKLEELLSEAENRCFFMKEDGLSATVEDFMPVLHSEENLDKQYGTGWRDKNIGFAVSIDKNILDRFFYSEENLNELFFASGFLQKNNNHRKAKVSTYAEEILPAIQEKLKSLKFEMKSYFVIAQTHPTYIQLTLHQVVKSSSNGEDAATIIIEDKVIQIEDVYDAMCKQIWKTLVPCGHINYCAIHKNNVNTSQDLGSAETYKSICQAIKQFVLEIFQPNNVFLEMDAKKEMDISNTCSCSMSLSLRNIIDVGLRPIIQKITTITAAALTNTELFRFYEVSYLFILGNPFSLSPNSIIYKMYSVLIQEAIDNSIESKEKDTQGFVLLESFDQLLIPVTHNKPYMFHNFISGKLAQVAGETYGIRLNEFRYQFYPPFYRIKRDGYQETKLAFESSYLVVLQKGQEIPITGLDIRLGLDSTFTEGLSVEIIGVQYPSKVVANEPIILPEDSVGIMSTLHVEKREEASARQIIVQFKHINYKSSLQISLRETGGEVGCSTEYPIQKLSIEEPLTLAYI